MMLRLSGDGAGQAGEQTPFWYHGGHGGHRAHRAKKPQCLRALRDLRVTSLDAAAQDTSRLNPETAGVLVLLGAIRYTSEPDDH